MRAKFVTPKGPASYDFEPGETVLDILLKNGYHPDTLIIMHDDVCIPDDAPIEESGEYKIVVVASGG